MQINKIGNVREVETDLVVIGSGPAGQKAAIQAVKLGFRAVVVEKDPHVGGACLNSGTIPSKSLREAILDLTEFHRKSFYGAQTDPSKVSLNDLNFRLNKILVGERTRLTKQFEKNSIPVLQGFGVLESANCVLVLDTQQNVLFRVRAQFIVVAAGSKPRNPDNIPFDAARVLDSTRLLSIDVLPKDLIVLGAGIVGTEYASFFAALGIKVTIVDQRSRLLPLLDSEIGMVLQEALIEQGVSLEVNASCRGIVKHDQGVQVQLSTGNTLEAEVLLYALGRSANVDGMGLAKIGIVLDPRGHIPVNSLFQTVVPNVYAVGDVIGSPALAATSMEQGRLATRHAFGAPTHYFPDFFPTGIYTIPEISCCGYTEETLRELGFNYQVGRAYYYEIARAVITGHFVGMFKILFHADTLEILGVHIVGQGATENIHIGQVAMTFKARIDYFVDQVFNYPTFAEGYRIAALNGLNKVKHTR